jgi:hypothetical protein
MITIGCRLMMGILKIIIWAAGLLAFLLTTQLFIRIVSAAVWSHIPKTLVGSIATYLALFGVLGALLSMIIFIVELRIIGFDPSFKRLLFSMPMAVILYVTTALYSTKFVNRVTAPHDAFERAYGLGWQDRIPRDLQDGMLKNRWSWSLPKTPEPRWEQDVYYATIPGTERNLLADLWQPPTDVEPSGLAYLYIHGGYYQIGEKGIAFPPLFTNLPTFSHLTSQGHVVMDIGYRLVDETDIFGMEGDVKRAIAWMKENAERYGVDPDRIVLAETWLKNFKTKASPPCWLSSLW